MKLPMILFNELLDDLFENKPGDPMKEQVREMTLNKFRSGELDGVPPGQYDLATMEELAISYHTLLMKKVGYVITEAGLKSQLWHKYYDSLMTGSEDENLMGCKLDITMDYEKKNYKPIQSNK